MMCVYYMTGAPEGSPKVVLWRSWESNLRPLVYKHSAYPLHHGGLLICLFLFCGFPGYRPVPPGWFKIVCWFNVGSTRRLTESGFMEKLGIEPATPGLQGIALIHYTTGASYLLIPMPKKIHNTLVATFNIMAIIISFI